MPLIHIDRPGFEDEDGVHFPMQCKDTIVQVLVTHAAIQGGGRPRKDGGYVPRFEAAREFFEILASKIFDAGPTEVTITRQDLFAEVFKGQKH
jgi:hypothetical protein